MADSGQQSLRIPLPLRDWTELNRRCSEHSVDVLARIEQLEQRMTDLEARVTALENP